MEITNNANLEINKQPEHVAETAGTIAKAEPKLFERVEDKPETTGSMGYTETAGTIASAGAETAGTVASSAGSSSGGSFTTVA